LNTKVWNTDEQFKAITNNQQASIDMRDKEIANIKKDLIKSTEDMERLKREYEEDSKKVFIENEANL
jgi:uncharacterized protein YecT (DUF1311 family)